MAYTSPKNYTGTKRVALAGVDQNVILNLIQSTPRRMQAIHVISYRYNL